MIRFSLTCGGDHAFEAWFRDNGDFEAQKKRGLVACPRCGDTSVEKALMAPAVSSGGGRAEQMALAGDKEQRRKLEQLKALSKKVREDADYVGERFPEEARRIHFGETDPRGIYGEASPDEARSLAEDGVEFMPLPVFPEDSN